MCVCVRVCKLNNARKHVTQHRSDMSQKEKKNNAATLCIVTLDYCVLYKYSYLLTYIKVSMPSTCAVLEASIPLQLWGQMCTHKGSRPGMRLAAAASSEC